MNFDDANPFTECAMYEIAYQDWCAYQMLAGEAPERIVTRDEWLAEFMERALEVGLDPFAIIKLIAGTGGEFIQRLREVRQ